MLYFSPLYVSILVSLDKSLLRISDNGSLYKKDHSKSHKKLARLNCTYEKIYCFLKKNLLRKNLEIVVFKNIAIFSKHNTAARYLKRSS